MNIQEIQNEALHLPKRDRAKLAQRLLISLDSPAEDRISTEWLLETQRRAGEPDKGIVRPAPSEEVARKAQKRAASWQALMRHVQGLAQSKDISEEDIAYEIDQVRNAR
uniref:Addiction module component n=1 Tax=Candidatus Kentrum sp. SD TaxID=2126332 RepID=A0A450Y8R6_9GAMM|nr:MAG: Putative addiction module component [Candidatus Kentron sp. SD]VFK42562.1 MAG: Putative addiction module component [Candidatus Kentron sp. SD]VFK77848.1 MAG: Putative addiction module component [Candidatus Kentron sp. SD]